MMMISPYICWDLFCRSIDATTTGCSLRLTARRSAAAVSPSAGTGGGAAASSRDLQFPNSGDPLVRQTEEEEEPTSHHGGGGGGGITITNHSHTYGVLQYK
uniref:Uncharacterized protein n=1 Tax=Oryza punctata TaxID=4537 RepID=A0A0E0K7R2_ORYPU